MFNTKNDSYFIIHFDGDHFKKNEVISSGLIECLVLKVYNKVWWRAILLWFGYKTKRYNHIKVRLILA